MTAQHHDNALLLGMLALRVGLVDRPTLVRILAEWRADAPRPFEPFFAEQAGLNDDDRAALEHLRRRALARHGEQAGTALAALENAAAPLDEKRLGGHPATVVEPLVVAGEDSTLTSGDRIPPVVDPLPRDPDAGRFRPLHLHARGGLGDVFVARDEELGRDVAVKKIREDRADSPLFRADFLREAQLTGLLEHPGVVPVYGLGTDADGRPFYAMRFIEGEELTAAIVRYHALAPDDTQRRVLLRELLRRFIEVCNTLAYAHSCGIIHRDVKPANIMLGRYGETLIVDWGLARLVHQPEDGASRRPDLEGAGTLAGQIKGTPAYMSPEQAAGQTAELGPACDIYGLGATLFYLLTGRPPYEEGSTAELLDRVRAGHLRRPSEVDSGVPPGLEAVCLKALALRPADRYATATELAEDVARWLADEPPRAYAEPWTGRVARLARRYRTATTAFGLALVAITLVSLLALLFVNRARNAETRAFDLLTAQRDLTDALREPAWERDPLPGLDALADRVARLDAVAGEEARQRVVDALVLSIQRDLERSLTEDARQRVEGRLKVLAARDPQRTAPLQARLAARVGDWQVLFNLVPPFDASAGVFEPASVVVVEGGLRTRAPPEAGRLPVVRTRQEAAGNVRLEATFDPSWQTAPLVGLTLPAGTTGGYEFVVASFEYTAVDPDLSRRESLGKAVETSERVFVGISRDGVLLSRTLLPLSDGPLRLRAERAGDRVVFQVQDHPPLVFDDLFAPAGGNAPFGVIWPSGVCVVRLRGSRQTLPREPSPLEKGDELYGRRQFDEAQAAYAEFAARTGDREAAGQARFKSALCLYERGRQDEAIEVLRSLVEGGWAGPWPMRALARLWLWALLDHRDADAEALFAKLPPELSVEELARQIPAGQRREALDTLRLRGPRWRAIYEPEENLARLEKAIRLEARLNESAYERRQTVWKIIDVCRVLGRLESARLLMEKLLDERDIPADEHVVYVRDLLWMKLLDPRRWAEAHADLDRLQREHPGPEYRALRLERARLYAAEKKWDEAEREIDAYLMAVGRNEGHYADFAEAHLMKGFLRELQDDAPGAKEAWKQGLSRQWQGRLLALPHGRLHGGLSEYQVSSAGYAELLLSSLTGELSREQAEPLLIGMTRGSGLHRKTLEVLARQNFPPEFALELLRALCQDERGRDIARRIAFRQVDLKGYYLDLLHHSGVVGFRLAALPPGPVPADVLECARRATTALYEAFRTSKLDHEALREVLELWHARAETAPAITWASLAPRLGAELRLRAAFIFGHRYAFLKRATDARPFLRELAESKDADFAVERRVAQELLRQFGS